MSLRIEVQADGTIEIMRPRGNRSQFVYYPNLESALIVIKYFIRQDLARALDEMFESQLVREARRAFNQLKGKTNAEIKKISAGSARS